MRTPSAFQLRILGSYRQLYNSTPQAVGEFFIPRQFQSATVSNFRVMSWQKIARDTNNQKRLGH